MTYEHLHLSGVLTQECILFGVLKQKVKRKKRTVEIRLGISIFPRAQISQEKEKKKLFYGTHQFSRKRFIQSSYNQRQAKTLYELAKVTFVESCEKFFGKFAPNAFCLFVCFFKKIYFSVRKRL